MATIAENLQKLITAKNNIIDALKDKGIEMPDNANLSSVSSLITSSSIAPQTVATDISKCGRLLTKFAVFSDIHLNSPYNTTDYQNNRGYQKATIAFDMLTTIKEELDFVAFNGDCIIDESGDANVFGALAPIFDTYREKLGNVPLYMIPGNHDRGTTIDVWHEVSKPNWDGVTFRDSDKVCFYKEINGDLYVWFGLWGSSSFSYSEGMYKWLFDLLDANSNRPRIFLFTHWFDGSVDNWGWRALAGQYYNNGWSTDEASHPTRGQFGKIKNYKNVIWFTGHSHTDWEYENTYPTIKVHANDTAKMVSIPSLYTNGELAIVSVYSNMVVIQPYKKNAVIMTEKVYFIGNATSVKKENVDILDWETIDSSHPTCLKLIYEVNDITTPTALVADGSQSGQSAYNMNYISDMYIDGVQVTPTATYQFGNAGKHIVLIQLAENHFHGGMFYKVHDLWSVSVPANVTNSAASVFKGCSKLKYARFGMTLSNKLENNFVDNVVKLEVVKFGAGVPGLNGANILANVPALTDIYIEGNTFDVTDAIGSTDISDTYIVHVNSGIDQNSIISKFPNATFVVDL